MKWYNSTVWGKTFFFLEWDFGSFHMKIWFCVYVCVQFSHLNYWTSLWSFQIFFWFAKNLWNNYRIFQMFYSTFSQQFHNIFSPILIQHSFTQLIQTRIGVMHMDSDWIGFLFATKIDVKSSISKVEILCFIWSYTEFSFSPWSDFVKLAVKIAKKICSHPSHCFKTRSKMAIFMWSTYHNQRLWLQRTWKFRRKVAWLLPLTFDGVYLCVLALPLLCYCDLFIYLLSSCTYSRLSQFIVKCAQLKPEKDNRGHKI